MGNIILNYTYTRLTAINLGGMIKIRKPISNISRINMQLNHKVFTALLKKTYPQEKHTVHYTLGCVEAIYISTLEITILIKLYWYTI